MRYLPTIIAADGREYVNIYYDNKADAERALEYFLRVFKEGNDATIIKAFIREI